MTERFLVTGNQVENECSDSTKPEFTPVYHVKAVSIYCLHPTQYVQTTFSNSNLPLIHSHSYPSSVLNCIPRAPTLQLVALLSLLWKYQLAWCCIAQFNHPNSRCDIRQGYYFSRVWFLYLLLAHNLMKNKIPSSGLGLLRESIREDWGEVVIQFVVICATGIAYWHTVYVQCKILWQSSQVTQ